MGAQADAELLEVCHQRAQLGLVLAGVQGVDEAVANVEKTCSNAVREAQRLVGAGEIQTGGVTSEASSRGGTSRSLNATSRQYRGCV